VCAILGLKSAELRGFGQEIWAQTHTCVVYIGMST